MGNHIHFILQPSQKANLSKIMQWVLSIFARKYNKLHNFKGHVWYDRFKSRILADIFEYINAYLYVMRNPVEAGLVKSPADYVYNGITFMLKGMMDLFSPS
jgi:putative transposase